MCGIVLVDPPQAVQPHDTLRFFARAQLSAPYLWSQQLIPTIKVPLTYHNSVYSSPGLLAAFLQACGIALVDPSQAKVKGELPDKLVDNDRIVSLLRSSHFYLM